MVRIVIASALLLGCLSNPTPHPAREADDAEAAAGDDAAPEADTHDVVPTADLHDAAPEVDTRDAASEADADTVDATDGSVIPGVPFPPADMRVREVYVLDLDQDGDDDLLVTNDPVAAEGRGVYVFFGRPERPDLSLADAFVPTLPRPAEVMRTTLVAGGGWELTVIGDAGDTGWIEIHPWNGAGFDLPLMRETTPWGWVPDSGSMPDDGRPVLLATTDVDGDGGPDLIAADLYRAFALRPDAWTQEALDVAARNELVPTPGWSAVLEVFVVGEGDARWLVVIEQNGPVRFFPIGADGLSLDDVLVDLGGEWNFGTLVKDSDGDGMPEVYCIRDNRVSVVVLSPPGAERFGWAGVPFDAMAGLDDLAVDDVDGQGDDDFVILDRGPSGTSSVIHVIRNPTYAGGELGSANSVATTTLGFDEHPRKIAAADLRGAGVEVWTFGLDGAVGCYAWGGARLERCAR